MRTRLRLLPILALVAALAACGGRQINIPTTPEILAAAEDNVHDAAVKALGILESAGRVTAAARAAAAQVDLPTAARTQLDQAFTAAAMRALGAIDAIESGAVTDWPALRAQLEPILRDVEALARIVETAAGRGSTLDLVQAAVDVVRGAVALIPAGAPALATGGAR